MHWIVTAGLLIALWAPAFASANGDMEAQFTSLIGRERGAAGLAAYTTRGDLADVARGQARRMAAEHRLYHNPDLTTQVQRWDAVGENVGRGPTVDEIHQAFMDSPTHRREIVSTEFTEVGVGVAIADDGEIWVAEVFRRPTATATQPSPARAPAPAAPVAPRPSPAPVARPRVTPPPPRPQPVAVLAASPEAAPASVAPTSTTMPDTVPQFLAMSLPRERPTVATSAAPAHEREVDLAVRIAATLLVLVVAAQTRYVVRETGGVRLVSSPRRKLVASAATLP